MKKDIYKVQHLFMTQYRGSAGACIMKAGHNKPTANVMLTTPNSVGRQCAHSLYALQCSIQSLKDGNKRGNKGMKVEQEETVTLFSVSKT